jgi:hypothetical protein
MTGAVRCVSSNMVVPCQIHRFLLIVMLLSCQALVYGHTESING